MYKTVKAKDHEEAIKKSGLRVGQLARITDLKATGNTDGLWTIHPEFQPLTKEEIDNLPLTDIL